MNVQYPPTSPPDVRTFEQLVPGTWYQGGETGRLYFFYLGRAGERRLIRADDNCECTERYQHAGTFRPVEVTVVVQASKPRWGGQA